MSAIDYFEDFDQKEQEFWQKDNPDKIIIPPCEKHLIEKVKQVVGKRVIWNWLFRFKACKACGHIFDFRWIDVRDLWDLGLIDKQQWKQAVLPFRKSAPSKEEMEQRYAWYNNEK